MKLWRLGYTETDQVREAQEMGAGPYLKKPLLLEDLGRVVKKTLNRPVDGLQKKSRQGGRTCRKTLKEPQLPGKKFVILSIDGGGIRGLIPATVLVELEKMIQAKRGDQKKIGDYFDFIAGTSTGGILTCLFLSPDPETPGCARFSAAQARDLYMAHGDEIFDRSIWQVISSLGGLSDEKYDAEALEKVLYNYLRELTLKELIKPCLVTGYDVRRYQPVRSRCRLR